MALIPLAFGGGRHGVGNSPIRVEAIRGALSEENLKTVIKLKVRLFCGTLVLWQF